MNKDKKIILIIILLVLITGLGVVLLITKSSNENSVLTTYKITLDVNGRASVLETDEEGILKEPDIPYGGGDSFLGWYIGDEKVDFSQPFTKNTTIRAKWK